MNIENLIVFVFRGPIILIDSIKLLAVGLIDYTARSRFELNLELESRSITKKILIGDLR